MCVLAKISSALYPLIHLLENIYNENTAYSVNHNFTTRTKVQPLLLSSNFVELYYHLADGP